MRLIYYSLARPSHAIYDAQWLQSIRSLRSHNASIPVWLFAFNGLSDVMHHEAERQNVQVIAMGDYADFLCSRHPHGSILARHPTLHKFLVLGEMATTGITQALYLDCDTFFFDDPEKLFALPALGHWHAREAPTSRLSRDGYDPANVSEDLLENIAENEHLRWIAPFNSGVCLLNARFWEPFTHLQDVFLDFAWRLLVGRHCSGGPTSHADTQSAVLRVMTEHDLERALPYPSQNEWILEEIALWLTLGRVPGFTQRMFGPSDVMLGPEFLAASDGSRRPIVAHYFTLHTNDFFAHNTPLAP
jgi:hypothetical protein